MDRVLIPNARASQSLLFPEMRAPLPWGMLFLLLFLLIMLGRAQEVISVLKPFRVGLVTGGLAALSWVLAPGSLQDKVSLELKQVRYILALLALAVITIPIAVWPGKS